MKKTRFFTFLAACRDSTQDAVRTLARWAGLAAREQLLPRKYCHFTALTLRGVPHRHIESAIKLQLNQLGLHASAGFAYKIDGEQAWVWHWDDKQVQRLFQAGKVLPCPEPLWRPAITVAIRHITCGEGFELEGKNAQGVYKSRWISHRADDSERAAFCRDLGLSADCAPQDPKPCEQHAQPQKGWKIYSALGTPPSPKLILAGLAIIAAGSLATIEIVHIVKLKQRTSALQAEAIELKKRTATISELESSLKQLQPLATLISGQIQAPRQAQLLGTLASKGVIGPGTDVYIAEWLYRGDSISATLRLGAKAKGASVLTALEATRLFSDIRLLPDPPAGTLRTELKIAKEGDPLPDGSAQKPASGIAAEPTGAARKSSSQNPVKN